MNRFDPEYLAFTIIGIVVSLVIHEFMHAYVGYLLGDSTAQREGRLSLNPIKHIDPVMTVALPIVTIVLFGSPILAAKPVPFDMRNVKYDEFGAAMIAAAGPLSNLVLAIIGALAESHLPGGSAIQYFFAIFTALNVSLFIFNLIPIPPLDGSRVLYAFAPEALQDAMRRIEPIGLFIIFLVVLSGGGAGILQHLDSKVLQLLPGGLSLY